jgi:hypothetical protein
MDAIGKPMAVVSIVTCLSVKRIMMGVLSIGRLVNKANYILDVGNLFFGSAGRQVSSKSIARPIRQPPRVASRWRLPDAIAGTVAAMNFMVVVATQFSPKISAGVWPSTHNEL